MCGIAGFAGLGDQADLAAMTAALTQGVATSNEPDRLAA
jgi:hypothetical protein